jgi:hypothetical protein
MILQGTGVSGYIGLQSHDDKSNVFFRNIEIKEIPNN